MFQFVTTTMDTYYSNRLLDRFRPGVSLRYRQLHSLQKNIINLKHVRETIYVVQEKVLLKESDSEIILDYLVDMDLGVCSCPTGAACRHQAAVAKEFKLASVNVAPVHSKQSRHTFAVIARGEQHTRGIEFYGDLMENDLQDKASDLPKLASNRDGGSSNVENSSMDEKIPPPSVFTESNSHDNSGSLKNVYQDALTEIMDDLTERLMEGDHNLISGVTKFIKSYKQMAKSQAPNSAISYALHNFGKSDSKLKALISPQNSHTVCTC